MKRSTAEQGAARQKLTTLIKNNKGTILPVIIVFCLPFLLYLQTLSFGFIGFDDNEIISNNIAFLSDFSHAPQAFLKDAFIKKDTNFYRPLQTLSYMTDIGLSGGHNTWMYHLTNILLLGLNACLLFLLLRKFMIPLPLALPSTLIYCAHPLFSSSIAWIPARGDLLLLLFSLLSFLFFVEYLKSKKGVFLFLNWLAFTFSLFCKETAALLPFLFLIYYFAFSCEKRFEKKDLLPVALYAVSGMFWFFLRSRSTGMSNQDDVGLTPFLANLQTIPESLANFFLPFDIALIPSYSILKTLIGLGLIAMMIVLFFINKEKPKKEKVFYLSWFLLLLLPTMLYKTDYIDYLSHRLFLPLIGILLFIIFSIPKKWFEEADLKRKIALNGGYFCIFALLSSLTFINTRYYSDPMTFYNSAISQNPNNVLMYNNRAYVKDYGGDFQGAINDYSRAIELNPNSALSFYNRGNAYLKKGDLDAAVKDYGKSIQLNPKDAGAYYNRGNVFRTMGALEKAVKDYDQAIALNPNFAGAYNNRGAVYNDAGNHETAVAYFSKALEADPEYAEAYYNRGTAYGYLGDQEKAVKDYDKAITLAPRYAEAYINRGLAYYARGDMKQAVENFDEAIALRPDFAFTYGVRGAAYHSLGYLTEAVKDYDKALTLDPSNANVYYDRGMAYKAKGLLKEAERDFNMFEKLKKP